MGDLSFSIADLFSLPFGGYGLTPWPNWLANFLLAPFGWFIPLMYILSASIHYVVSTVRMRPASRTDIAAISAAVALFMSFHSESWDPWRHTVPFILIIYIGLILRISCTGAFLAEFLRSKLPLAAKEQLKPQSAWRGNPT
jgi:hypothetical protein